MTTITLPVFATGRPAAHVDASLRQALNACDRARECAVLWFAEVQRRALYRELGHASLQLYATQALGFSDNRYWQFKRLADDLERLPALHEAVATGELGWTKAQQVARVATAETQAAWVERARTSSRRVLEAEVKAARRRPSIDAAPQLALGAPVVKAVPQVEVPTTITLRADGLQLARFEALLEKARKLRVLPAGADKLEVVLAGLEALVADAAGATTQGPSVQVVVQQCPTCEAAAVVTSRGERRLAPAQVAALACDVRVRRKGERNRATIAPSVRAGVLARDRHRCTTPGCGSSRFLEVHHVVPRARGGANQVENLITLCRRCHQFAHEHPAVAPAQVAKPVVAMPAVGGSATDRGLAPAQVGELRPDTP
jgi:5-methylcytosine-specific restriction endonuclease McrA